MSIRAIPLLVLAVIIYNVIVLFGGDASPTDVLKEKVFGIMLPNGKYPWEFSKGDLIILLTLLLMFFELLKATYTSTTQLVDHGLSMMVFIVCLIEFLMVGVAQTSTFFFVTVAALIDVIAGYTISVRVARRDFSIGG